MKKPTKQDQVIYELQEINAKLKINLTELDAINKTLKNKTLEVETKRSMEGIVFTSLYGICAALIVYGITVKYDFNSFMSTGLIGLLFVFFIMLIYYINN